jgi:hypothetical protein
MSLIDFVLSEWIVKDWLQKSNTSVNFVNLTASILMLRTSSRNTVYAGVGISFHFISFQEIEMLLVELTALRARGEHSYNHQTLMKLPTKWTSKL